MIMHIELTEDIIRKQHTDTILRDTGVIRKPGPHQNDSELFTQTNITPFNYCVVKLQTTLCVFSPFASSAETFQ